MFRGWQSFDAFESLDPRVVISHGTGEKAIMRTLPLPWSKGSWAKADTFAAFGPARRWQMVPDPTLTIAGFR